MFIEPFEPFITLIMANYREDGLDVFCLGSVCSLLSPCFLPLVWTEKEGWELVGHWLRVI